MKKNYFRIISAWLAALMILGCFAFVIGCNDTPEETTVPEENSSTPDPEQTESVEYDDILKADLSKYVLVRPERITDALADVFKEVHQLLKTEYSMEDYKDDFYREDVPAYRIGEYEILLGNTNRPETAQFLKGLKYNDYGYALVGKKIVVAGHTDDGTAYAVRKFINDVINKKDQEGDVFYKSEYDYVNRATYPVKELYIGEIPASEFRIVYSAKHSFSEDTSAELIFKAIAKLSGEVLEVISDKTERGDHKHEIIIGATTHNSEAELSAITAGLGETESVISFNGTDLNIYGPTTTSLLVATNQLVEKFSSEKVDKYTVTLEAKTVCKYDDSVLKAMSFNVWVSGKTVERNARVITMVKNYLPDTVGFQEVDPVWYSTLKTGLGDIYAYVGEGRDGGTKGEANPIFYKKDVFNLLESGTKWLSATPDKVSKYEESSLNRIFTYALLEKKSDGTKIMIINTHYDHKSSEAREKQSKVLMEFIKGITDYPIVLTGDFNCLDSTSEYSTIVKNGMTNSYSLADKKINNVATYTNYGASNKIIDFVFVTAKKIAVTQYQVCNEKINGDFPSDHHPVLIEYAILG